jgi:hypothetical protein
MARRKDGQGTIYRRSDGRWEAQLRLAPTGSRKSVYAKSRREVLRRLREARWLFAQGLPVSARKVTLEVFLAGWLELIRHRIRPSTYDSYELNVRRVNEILGVRPPSNWSTSLVVVGGSESPIGGK